jgi:hypothetical protein
MRYSVLLLLLVGLPLLASPAQDEEKKQAKEPPRYGFDNNPLYLQKTPKDAMASILKAIDNQRVDYLLAQLADPPFVDRQVEGFKALFPSAKDDARTLLAFDKLVAETNRYFQSDPTLLKQLRKFARDAEWEMGDEVASGTLKDVPGRKVFLKKIGERWYLENRQQ